MLRTKDYFSVVVWRRYITRYYKVILGDSRQMPEVQSNTVQMIVTSPPYGTLDVFTKDENERGAEFDLSRYHNLRTFFQEIAKTWKEAERVLKPGGVMVVEWEDYPVGSRYYGYPREIALCGPMVESIEKSGLGLISRWFIRKFEAGVALEKFQYTMYSNLRSATPRAIANVAYAFAFIKKEYKPSPHKLDFKREDWAIWSDGLWNINFIGCYDKQTEVLTEAGWKYFNDLTYEDKIACLGGVFGLCYCKPVNIIKYPYKGDMVRFKSNSADLLVTPEHNFYVVSKNSNLPKSGDDYGLCSVNELTNKYFILKRDVEWFGEEKEFFELPSVTYSENYYPAKTGIKKLPMDLWLRFFGFWLAEGHVTIIKEKSVYTTGFRAFDENREWLLPICEALGFKVCNSKEKGKVQISGKQLSYYLRQFGKAGEKYIPRDLLRLSRRQLRILLESYMRGDAHIESYTCYTSSVRLRDDLQELALKCGYAATYSLHRKAGFEVYSEKFKRVIRQNYDSWIVHIIRGQLRPRVTKYGWSSEYYDDYVYSVEVPTHTIYVRRNGKPLWCGNSGLDISGGATFPISFAKRCIKIYSNPGDIILDPFLGTGTTMKAAFELGRSCIGYEVLERMLPIIKAKTQYGTQDIYEPVSWEVMNRYTEVKV